MGSDAQKVLDVVKYFILKKVPEVTNCSDDEVIKQRNVYVDLFTVFGSVFTNSRTPVGHLSEVKEEETYKGIALGLKM